MFDNLKTDEGIQKDKDSVGGGSYILETGVYPFTLDAVYVDESSGGAMTLNFVAKNQDGKELRQTIYMTGGRAKGQKNYYMVKDRKTHQETGEKAYLPGFNIANAICLLAIGEEISSLKAEEKSLMLYDYDLKKDAPQKKKVLTALCGAEITFAVIKQIVDKKINTGTKEAPVWTATGETREINEVGKVFRTSDGMTVAEITAEATEAVFITTWADKNTGVTQDNSTKVAGTGTAGAPTTTPTGDGGNAAAPSTSLFKK